MVPLACGRITALVMKDACRTNQENPAKSLIKKIFYKKEFRSIASDWGCMHEDEARAAYVDVVSKEHQNFSIKTSGLIINPCWPYIGASPDGIVECSCCGVRCHEIKCPYSYRNSNIQALIDNDLCIYRDSNSNVLVKEDHEYYYQMQT